MTKVFSVIALIFIACLENTLHVIESWFSIQTLITIRFHSMNWLDKDFNKSLIFLIITLVLSIWVVNCTSIKDLKSNPAMVHVSFKILKHDPYCGGAYPTDEQKKGTLTYLERQLFYLKKGLINHDSIPILAKVITDSTGTFELKLDTGTYSMIFPEKHLPFTKYLETVNIESQYIKAGSESCFAKWWATPDARFSVLDTTTQIECILKRTCYTGFNPCLVYTGPLRR